MYHGCYSKCINGVCWRSFHYSRIKEAICSVCRAKGFRPTQALFPQVIDHSIFCHLSPSRRKDPSLSVWGSHVGDNRPEKVHNSLRVDKGWRFKEWSRSSIFYLLQILSKGRHHVWFQVPTFIFDRYQFIKYILLYHA